MIVLMVRFVVTIHTFDGKSSSFVFITYMANQHKKIEQCNLFAQAANQQMKCAGTISQLKYEIMF
jgi:hypothetical protein